MKQTNLKQFSLLNRRRFLSLAGVSLGALAVTSFVPQSSNAEMVDGLFDNIPLEDKVMGKEDAPIAIVEYASMTCPHCRKFHEEVLPKIKKDYIETGKAKYILRPFPFDGDRRGEAAFMLAYCVPNGNYYAMVDALFSTQKSWASEGNPVPELLRLSKLSGMTEKDFEACLKNQDLLTKMVNGRNKAVKEFGVRATPTLFVNGKKLGDSTLETLSKALESAM